MKKYLIGTFLVTVLLTVFFNFFPIKQIEAQSCGGGTVLMDIYTLYSNEAGDSFCCCPGSMECGAVCCPGC